MQLRRRPLLSPLWVLGLAACGNQMPGGTADMAPGSKPMPIEYYSGSASAKLGAQSNGATCATCHSNDGTPRSGNTFKDMAFHASFKGGEAKTLLDATNACVTGWMGGTALKEADEAWTGLKSYLESISDRSKTTANAIAPEVLDDQAAYEAAYGGGNAQAGAAKYTKACGVCHDGTLQVGPAKALAKSALKNFPIGRIAQKVRTAGPPPSGKKDASDSTPGPMPFFEPSELPAQDLKDIIAHVKS